MFRYVSEQASGPGQTPGLAQIVFLKAVALDLGAKCQFTAAVCIKIGNLTEGKIAHENTEGKPDR